MIKKALLVIVLLVAKILNAQIYDPFYLKTDRDLVNNVAWLNLNKKPLFYFNLAFEAEVESIIFMAQKLKVMLLIDSQKLILKKIRKKDMDKSLYLPEVDLKPAFKILTDQNIEFEWLIIPAQDIYRTSAELVYAIKTKIGVFWLSEKQEKVLLLLKDLGAQKLKVNLSAINVKKPYRNIPESEVFMAVGP